MALPQKELFKLESTRGDMVFSVDYNDAGAVDPGPDDLFWSQLAVDQFLAANGATNFKHLTAVWNALPGIIKHNITINLAEGIHRPRPEEAGGEDGFPLRGKYVDYDAGVQITLDGAASWTSVDVSLEDVAINTVTAGGDDPVLNFAGTPFNGFDLKGFWAVLDTGQIVVIHDHDDSNLYLLQEISPASPTTVTVAYPGTILRNSMDDVNWLGNRTCLNIVTQNLTSRAFQQVNLNRLTFQFGRYFNFGSDAFCWLTNCYLDNVTGIAVLGSAVGVTLYPWGCFFIHSSFRGAANSNGFGWTTGFSTTLQAFLFLQYSYLGKSQYGLGLDNTWITFVQSVIDEMGTYNGDDGGAVRLRGASQLDIYKYDAGHPSEIRGTRIGLVVDTKGLATAVRDFGEQELWFKDMLGPVVRILENGLYKGTHNLMDGGGNADVGWEFTGSHARVHIDPDSNITGTNGDIRLKGGEIVDYATVVADGPLTDEGLNILEKDS